MKTKKNPKTGQEKKEEGKLFYRIEEVSRLTGIDEGTIAAWEKAFPFLTAGVTGAGIKFFRAQDVAIIRRLAELQQNEDLTQAGIKRRIEDEFGLARPPAAHPETMQKILTIIKDELQDILCFLSNRPKND